MELFKKRRWNNERMLRNITEKELTRTGLTKKRVGFVLIHLEKIR